MRGDVVPTSPGSAGSGGEEHLTARERQVLAHIAEGLTERQIAQRLGLSPKTVHTHRTNMMSKLGVHNVVALVRRALESGLVPA
jgi:DNA-binding CsgD family transcriptional regulator